MLRRAAALRALVAVAMLIGWFGQVHARTLLPQPAAFAEKTAAAPDEARGMEPGSDLLGEASITEAEERDDCMDRLHCISVTGWALAAIPADGLLMPPPVVPPALRPHIPRLSALRFDLLLKALDPPRA